MREDELKGGNSAKCFSVGPPQTGAQWQEERQGEGAICAGRPLNETRAAEAHNGDVKTSFLEHSSANSSS